MSRRRRTECAELIVGTRRIQGPPRLQDPCPTRAGMWPPAQPRPRPASTSWYRYAIRFAEAGTRRLEPPALYIRSIIALRHSSVQRVRRKWMRMRSSEEADAVTRSAYDVHRETRVSVLAPCSASLGTPEFGNRGSWPQQSTPWAQGTESKHTRMITSGRAFRPIDESSPPAAPRPTRWTSRGTRSACASRRPALSGWRRSRSSRRLYWARTLAFRRLTRAPLSVGYAHEYLVHMPPATLKGHLPARRTDGTLAHDCLPWFFA